MHGVGKGGAIGGASVQEDRAGGTTGAACRGTGQVTPLAGPACREGSQVYQLQGGRGLPGSLRALTSLKASLPPVHSGTFLLQKKVPE